GVQNPRREDRLAPDVAVEQAEDRSVLRSLFEEGGDLGVPDACGLEEAVDLAVAEAPTKEVPGELAELGLVRKPGQVKLHQRGSFSVPLFARNVHQSLTELTRREVLVHLMLRRQVRTAVLEQPGRAAANLDDLTIASSRKR